MGEDELIQPNPRPRPPMKTAVALVGLGVLIGILVASQLEWRKTEPAPPLQTLPAPVVRPSVAPVSVTNRDQRDFVQVVRTVSPAVANISTTRGRRGGGVKRGLPFEDPFFHRFFGEDPSPGLESPRERRAESLGSGVIVDASGLIITNNHVVSQADEIKVLLEDKREFTAKLIGTDPKTDLAVLKVEAGALQTVRWADSDRLEVGELVLAIGNPFGLNQTVTMGIVSAVGRARMGIAEYEDFIQTDAAINPGNSGGPLVNARGELVGINTAIFSRSGGSMGIGFAVPSNMARSILEQLVTSGKVVRGWLGVSIQDVTPELAAQFGVSESTGALVSDVLEGSPAKRAGLERGDIIIEFDAKKVDTPSQLKNVVAQTQVGKAARVTMIRDKRVHHLDVVIGEQPEPQA